MAKQTGSYYDSIDILIPELNIPILYKEEMQYDVTKSVW